jgi:hypothetical protein
MLRAHVLHRSAVCCPSCRSDDYSTYRRLPADSGRIVNRCSCRKCGAGFEYVEDRQGKPVRS